MKIHKPDLHHEGPITLVVVRDTKEQLEKAQREIEQYPNPLGSQEELSWQICAQGWWDNIGYALFRLREVEDWIQSGAPIRDEVERVIVDICLCIIRDFKAAKERNFLGDDEGNPNEGELPGANGSE